MAATEDGTTWMCVLCRTASLVCKLQILILRQCSPLYEKRLMLGFRDDTSKLKLPARI
jgi:hypothetical protein